MPRPTKFHVVRTETSVQEMTLAEALDAVLAEVRADQPVAALVGWEMPDGSLKLRAIPESEALKRGLLADLGRTLAPAVAE